MKGKQKCKKPIEHHRVIDRACLCDLFHFFSRIFIEYCEEATPLFHGH